MLEPLMSLLPTDARHDTASPMPRLRCFISITALHVATIAELRYRSPLYRVADTPYFDCLCRCHAIRFLRHCHVSDAFYIDTRYRLRYAADWRLFFLRKRAIMRYAYADVARYVAMLHTLTPYYFDATPLRYV